MDALPCSTDNSTCCFESSSSATNATSYSMDNNFCYTIDNSSDSAGNATDDLCSTIEDRLIIGGWEWTCGRQLATFSKVFSVQFESESERGHLMQSTICLKETHFCRVTSAARVLSAWEKTALCRRKRMNIWLSLNSEMTYVNMSNACLPIYLRCRLLL